MKSTVNARLTFKHCAMAVNALLMVVALACLPASAQVIEPLPTPNLNLVASGTVYAIARQPDGGTIIGGQFTSVNNVARNNIARRKPDGSLDLDWNPSIDGAVMALAVDQDGNVYVGGDFDHVDGFARRHLAKLAGFGTGEVIAGWDPSPDDIVYAITANAGSVYAGGVFHSIGGQQRSSLAKVSLSSGTVDALWNPAPVDNGSPSMVLALELSHDGNLYVGGAFTAIGGADRRNIAKLSLSGNGAADPVWNPSPNRAVRDIAVAPDGSVFITGDFYEIGVDDASLYRWNVAKLSGVGGGIPDPIWDPVPGGQFLWANHVVVGTDGNVYFGGGLYGFVLIRASATGNGAIDTTWHPQPQGTVSAILAMSDGSVLAGGNFNYVSDAPYLGFAAIDANGIPGVAFDIEAATGSVRAFANQADGAVIVGGNFMKADGHPRRHLLRLLPDGNLDLAWNPAANGLVVALATGTDGAVYAGGYFTTVNGEPRSGLVKLTGGGNGSVFADWSPAIQSATLAIAIDQDGHVFAGGSPMTVIDSPETQYLIKLSADTGEVDLNWAPQPNGVVNGLLLDGDGHLFAWGDFVSIGGQQRRSLAKLSVTGTGLADPVWNPVVSGRVKNVVSDDNASLYLSGDSFRLADSPDQWRGFCRISAMGTGSLDTSWNPTPVYGRIRDMTLDDAGFLYAITDTYLGGDPSDTDYKLNRYSTVDSGMLDTAWLPTNRGYPGPMRFTSGRLLVGGSFTRIGSQNRNSIAALPTTIPDAIFGNGFQSP